MKIKTQNRINFTKYILRQIKAQKSLNYSEQFVRINHYGAAKDCNVSAAAIQKWLCQFKSENLLTDFKSENRHIINYSTELRVAKAYAFNYENLQKELLIQNPIDMFSIRFNLDEKFIIDDVDFSGRTCSSFSYLKKTLHAIVSEKYNLSINSIFDVKSAYANYISIVNTGKMLDYDIYDRMANEIDGCIESCNWSIKREKSNVYDRDAMKKYFQKAYTFKSKNSKERKDVYNWIADKIGEVPGNLNWIGSFIESMVLYYFLKKGFFITNKYDGFFFGKDIVDYIQSKNKDVNDYFNNLILKIGLYLYNLKTNSKDSKLEINRYCYKQTKDLITKINNIYNLIFINPINNFNLYNNDTLAVEEDIKEQESFNDTLEFNIINMKNDNIINQKDENNVIETAQSGSENKYDDTYKKFWTYKINKAVPVMRPQEELDALRKEFEADL